MNPSTRKPILTMILGVALMALSFIFFAMTDRPQIDPPVSTQHIYEWAAATLILAGFFAFGISSVFLSFILRPTGALLLGSILLSICVAFFFAAIPFSSPHSWTFLFVLLPIPNSFFAALVVLIGLVRWIKLRRIDTSN
jgi:hypothetical protein